MAYAYAILPRNSNSEAYSVSIDIAEGYLLAEDEENKQSAYHNPYSEARLTITENKASPSYELPNSPSSSDLTTSLARRDWNEEFQQIYALPTTTTAERILKARQLVQISEAFVQCATLIGQTIIHEASLPNILKTVAPSDTVGGVAGGAKFLYGGVFFKFARDERGIYGDDQYAMKSANREMRAIAKLIECSATIGGLHYPLVALIDYLGQRLIASAILPLKGAKSLIYGSSDQARTVHSDIPEMNAKMAHAIGSLNLKEHPVGRGQEYTSGATPPVMIYGPADIEGHRGTDNRFYVIDAARLYPPVAMTRFAHAIILPADDHEPIADCPLEWMNPPNLTLSNNTSTDRRVNIVIDHAKKWLEERHRTHVELVLPTTAAATSTPTTPTSEFCVVSLPLPQIAGRIIWLERSGASTVEAVRWPHNGRASQLIRRSIHGDAVVYANDFVGRHLWHLLRPEAVAKQPRPLSSDAFTAFGLHNREANNLEVTMATEWVIYHAIPSLAAALDRGEEVIGPSGCRHDNGVVAILHRRGINLRRLGMVAALVQRRGIRSLLLVEMCSRVCKSLLKRALRNVTTSTANRLAAVAFFNVVLGNSPTSTLFWEKEMPVWLRLVFPLDARDSVLLTSDTGATSTATASTTPTTTTPVLSYRNLRSEILKDTLFQSLQLSTGIVATTQIQQRFHNNPTLFETPSPFTENDIHLQVQVKRIPVEPLIELSIEQTLREEFDSTLLSSSLLHGNQGNTTANNDLQRALRRCELVEAIYGTASAVTGVCHLRTAELILHTITMQSPLPSSPRPSNTNEILNAAAEQLSKGRQCLETLESKEISAELAIGYFYLDGCLQDARMEWRNAYISFGAALAVSEKFFGDGEPGGVGLGHPIGTILTIRLAELTSDQRLNKCVESFRYSLMSANYLKHYPLADVSKEVLVLLFGSRDPLALRGLVKPDPAVGMSDPRVKAWRQLVDVLDNSGELHVNVSILHDAMEEMITAAAKADAASVPSVIDNAEDLNKPVINALQTVGEGSLYIFGTGKNGCLHHSELFKEQTVPCRVPNDWFHGKPPQVLSLACSTRHIVVATSVGVFAWGSQLYGCLGNGSTQDLVVFVPTEIEELRPAIGGSAKVAKVACGSKHNAALTIYGDVFTWGKNASGQLGQGNFKDLSRPRRIDHADLLGTVVDVACGSECTLAVTTTGEVYSFGSGATSSLGHGSFTVSLTVPHKIQALLGSKVIAVAAGDTHAMALSVNDRSTVVWTWGQGPFGELGHPQDVVATATASSTKKSSKSGSFDMDNVVEDGTPREWAPRMVEALHGICIRKIEAAHASSIALSQDGGLYLWGRLGLSTSSSLPTRQTAVVGEVVAARVGLSHVVAITKEGKAWVWGACAWGQLGNKRTYGRVDRPMEVLLGNEMVRDAAVTFGCTLLACQDIPTRNTAFAVPSSHCERTFRYGTNLPSLYEK